MNYVTAYGQPNAYSKINWYAEKNFKDSFKIIGSRL